MLYEPPPQRNIFDWIWIKWIYGFWQRFNDLASTDTDDTEGGFHLVHYPPLSGETGVTDYEYVYGDVRRYGADGVGDNTSALQNLASSVIGAGIKSIIFEKGKTYSIWPDGTGTTLFDLTGASGITVYGNGATLSAGSVDSSDPIVFELDGADSFVACNLNYTQTYQTLDKSNGGVLFNMQNGGYNFCFINIAQTGGLRGIHCIGTIAAGGAAVNGVTALNCTFTSVYYPQQFRMSGNNYFARGIRTINCGRGYFPFNVYNHDVEMFSQHGGPFDDVLLKNYTYTAEYSKLENIKLVYHSDKRHASANAQASPQALIILEAQLIDIEPAEITNIDIQVNITATATLPAYGVFNIRKLNQAGTTDAVARGHKITNLKLSGHVRNWENGGGTAVRIFDNIGFNWVGDYASNVDLSDLRIEDSVGTNTAININGQPFSATSPFSMRNVIADSYIYRVNWDTQYPFSARNVIASNLVILDSWKDYTPVWGASGTAPAIGNGTVLGRYNRNGDIVTVAIQLIAGSTTTFGTGTYTFSLPVISDNGISGLGSSLLIDNSTGYRYAGTAEGINNSLNARLWYGTSTTQVGATVPFTFADGDYIMFSLTYNAAF